MPKRKSSTSETSRFSDRLNDALDNIFFPKLGGGRQSRQSELLEVSSSEVGKWLKGESFPATSALVKLSELTKARSNWLLSGQGEPYNKGKSPRGKGENAPVTGKDKLNKEAFDLGKAWMELPKLQREVIARVIRELADAHQS